MVLTALALLAASGVAAGCSGGEDSPPSPPATAGAPAEPATPIVQPGAPGEPSRAITADEAVELQRVEHTPADVEFMQGMLHHHAQALVMTDLARDLRRGGDVALFARRMDISQLDEIERMETWLRDRDEPVPTAAEHEREHGPGGERMPGMLDREELGQLAAARGATFDHLFLRGMTRHHRGALAMVAALRADGGGLEPEIDAFARHVEADQDIELGRMDDLRSALGPAPAGAMAEPTGFAASAPGLCILE
jgi:uncharacterized protein (DUF305 family)